MRVLVIEDHPDLAANLGDYLAAQGDAVDFAADGATGLLRAQDGGADVIVLDRLLRGIAASARVSIGSLLRTLASLHGPKHSA